MKKNILLIALILFSNYFYSQESFNYKTQLRKIADNNYKEENFNFIFNENLQTIKMIDEDYSITTETPVVFYDSSYSQDGKAFIISYVANFKKLFREKKDLNKIPNFLFFYDKKLGNLLWINVTFQRYDSDNIDFTTISNQYFFTEKGKIFYEFLKN